MFTMIERRHTGMRVNVRNGGKVSDTFVITKSVVLLLLALGLGSSRLEFPDRAHWSNGINVVGCAGQANGCLTSCGDLPQLAHTLRLAYFFILLL